MYESKEDRGWLEVCLVLTSEYQAVLSAPLSVTLTPIQTTSTIFVRGGFSVLFPCMWSVTGC